jgi:protein-tyrosine phosphatase
MKTYLTFLLFLMVLVSCKQQAKKAKHSEQTEKTVVIDSLFKDKRYIYSAQVDNMRDIGGYPTKNGKRVAWGKVYRSGALSGMDSLDFIIFDSLQIKKVYDLRTNTEVKEKPDSLPDNIAHMHLAIGKDDWGDQKEFFQKMNELELDSLDAWILDLYKIIPIDYADQYKIFFKDLIAQDDLPVLYHCTAGKDRTGIATALLLYILEVPMDYIKADYALSNVYREKANMKYAKMMEEQGINYEQALVLLKVKPEYMDSIFENIASRYGSIDQYLFGTLGISDADREILRKKFIIE